MIRAGKDPNTVMPIIKEWLGHRSIKACEGYLRLTSELYPDLREIMSLIEKKSKQITFMKNETDFARYLTKFLGNYLPHQRNVSPKTVSSYSTSFYLFLSLMLECKGIEAGKVALADFAKATIEEILEWLSDKRSCRETTINNRRAAMCSFAKYLQYEVVDRMAQWQRIMGISPVKSPKPEVNYLEMEAISLIFK